MMKRWMYGTVILAFISVYSNPFDCDFEKDPCSWSLEGFRRISYNQSNSTGGMNDDKPRNDCNILNRLCSWKGNGCTFATDELYHAVMECKSPLDQSILSSDVEISPGEKCLSFKYQTKDFQRENVYIDVQSYYENQWSIVWKSGWQQQFQGWKEIGAEINLPNKSSITIRFVQRNCSNVTYYISNISLKKQSCTESKTTFAEFPTSIPNVTVTDTTVATSTAARTVTTSTYSANAYAIMATAIGCLVMIVAVLLAAVCYYRRRYSNSVPNASTTNTGLYEPHVVVSSQDNYAQIISLSSESENNMSDSVNYNPEPEYFTIAE